MRWGEYFQPVGGIALHSQRMAIAASFPAGTLAVEEALSRPLTAVLIGYPYYERKGVVRAFPSATHKIRRRLYRLALPSAALHIADLGDLWVEDPTPEKVAQTLEELCTSILRAGHKIVLFGGGQEAAHPIYKAVAAQETPFTYTLLDRKLDLLDAISVEEASHRSYHRDMLLDETVGVPAWGQIVGLAWHWVSAAEEELLHAHLRAPYLRLHELLEDPDAAEPFLRTPAFISMDLGIVRGADAPAVIDPEPEGLPIEMAAKLLRFAGMGYRAEVLHIANYLPHRDKDGRTASAVALLLWYFLEGRINPQEDFPRPDRSNLVRYEVPLVEMDAPLVFYQHPRSGRWWIEVTPSGSRGLARLFPCRKKEYEEALAGELPRLWYLLQLSMPA